MCSRWVVKSGTSAPAARKAVLAAAEWNFSATAKQSGALLNQCNRILWDSQEAVSTRAFEFCGFALSAFIAGSRRVKVPGQRYACGALCLKAQASTWLTADIQTCPSSLPLSQRLWMTSSDLALEKQSEIFSAGSCYHGLQVQLGCKSVKEKPQAVWKGFGEALSLRESANSRCGYCFAITILGR